MSNVEDGVVLAYNRLSTQFDVLGIERDALLAENQRLREALERLDAPLQWIAENYPAALQAMPSEAYLAIGQAREALAGDGE